MVYDLLVLLSNWKCFMAKRCTLNFVYFLSTSRAYSFSPHRVHKAIMLQGVSGGSGWGWFFFFLCCCSFTRRGYFLLQHPRGIYDRIVSVRSFPTRAREGLFDVCVWCCVRRTGVIVNTVIYSSWSLCRSERSLKMFRCHRPPIRSFVQCTTFVLQLAGNDTRGMIRAI